MYFNEILIFQSVVLNKSHCVLKFSNVIYHGHAKLHKHKGISSSHSRRNIHVKEFRKNRRQTLDVTILSSIFFLNALYKITFCSTVHDPCIHMFKGYLMWI